MTTEESVNQIWLSRILKLLQYLGDPHRALTAEDPNYFIREPGHWRDLEVTPDGEEGALHSIREGRTVRDLSPEQLEAKLESIHAALKVRGMEKAEKEVLRDLATKKLEEVGIC